MGKNSMECAGAVGLIGQVHLAQGNLEAALKHYQECLAIKQAVKGEEAAECAITLNNMGSVCHSLGRG